MQIRYEMVSKAHVHQLTVSMHLSKRVGEVVPGVVVYLSYDG